VIEIRVVKGVAQDKHQMVFNIEIGGEGNSKRGHKRMTDIEMV
jgi:hypothetical protein